MNSNRILTAPVASLACPLAGCGQSVPLCVEVQGRILRDGEPVSDAWVMLTCPKANSPGKDDAEKFAADIVDGEFQIPSSH